MFSKRTAIWDASSGPVSGRAMRVPHEGATAKERQNPKGIREQLESRENTQKTCHEFKYAT